LSTAELLHRNVGPPGLHNWKVRIRHRPVLVLLVMALMGVLLSPAAHASPPIDLDHPVQGEVTRGFDPPGERWGAGHRGVDLAAAPGSTVRASADGVVSFQGTIVGRGVVAVTHRPGTRLRTTYEPVEAVVRAGEHVRRGQVIGRMQAVVDRHDGLHWGLIEGETYLDPLSHSPGSPSVRPGEVRLLPAGATPRPVEVEEAVITPVPTGLPWLAGGGTRPADGPLTSGFGMRLHPVLHVWKLHDGLDIGAPCGAPARSALAGTVVATERHVAYGNRVIIDHGGSSTGYAHLAAVNVAVGQRVAAGQQVGLVGTTGWSTGCHLHVMAWRDGRLVDPSWLVARR
jgi:murein DD-endopeptidase MepM/ murein hydrolase activator NlpD